MIYKDRFGRVVGGLVTTGGNVLNLQMVLAGRAVVYSRYCSDDRYATSRSKARRKPLDPGSGHTTGFTRPRGRMGAAWFSAPGVTKRCGRRYGCSTKRYWAWLSKPRWPGCLEARIPLFLMI